MKTIFCLLAAVPMFCMGTVFSQDKEAPVPPESVKEAFSKKFEGITPTEWEIDKKGHWEAKFSKDEKKMRADFSPEAEWLKTEQTLKLEDLPEPVKKVISEKHSGEEIDKIEWVDSAEKGEFYAIEFKKEGKDLKVEYLASGEPVE